MVARDLLAEGGDVEQLEGGLLALEHLKWIWRVSDGLRCEKMRRREGGGRRCGGGKGLGRREGV